MGFASDRDLLVVEPNVFRDVPVLGQQVVRVEDGVVSGTTLTSAVADFVGGQVGAGYVALVGGVGVEVLSRTDANTLEVSLLRADLADAGVGPGDGSGLEVIVRTFGAQMAMVHGVLLRLFGIDLDDPGQGFGSEVVVSSGVMRELEVLGTLERVYSAAVALTGDNAGVRAKARLYRERCNEACRGAVVLMDLDGDGYAETARRVGMGRMRRG